MTDRKTTLWSPPEQPDWVTAMNREGDYFDLPAVVPLDERSLLDHAQRATGLRDFGDDLWRAPFEVLLHGLNNEAELTLLGRLMARSDIVIWLSTRLRVTDELKRQPDILDQPVASPMFIVGLPRSGTSILYELLSRDPEVGVPLMWEALQPCPPPEEASY
ncbi:MAG: sulfotransferase, partial [Pseudomonadota bacterium]